MKNAKVTMTHYYMVELGGECGMIRKAIPDGMKGVVMRISTKQPINDFSTA